MSETEESQFPPEEEVYNYASSVDIHCIGSKYRLDNVVALAVEHGFRGIVTLPCFIEDLAKELKKQNSAILPVCVLDYPYGVSTTDVRNYSIIAAKEKGAKEIEIVCPNHLVGDFKQIENDVRALSLVASKSGLKLKYLVDTSTLAEEGCLTRIGRICHNFGVGISVFNSKRIDHSDNILKIRSIKNKTNIKTKVYLADPTIEIVTLYNKAGIDVLSFDAKNAASIVHEYEEQLKA